MHRALRPGGRIAAIVYSTPTATSSSRSRSSIIRRRAAAAAAGAGPAGTVQPRRPRRARGRAHRAGFRDVGVETVPAPLRLPSAAECVRFERESFGALHQMLAGCRPSERDGRVGRDRGRARPLRDRRRVRRAVRAARRLRGRSERVGCVTRPRSRPPRCSSTATPPSSEGRASSSARRPAEGAGLIVFPEAFVPAYPDWVWRTAAWRDRTVVPPARRPGGGRSPAPATDRLGAARPGRRRLAWPSGVNERDQRGATLYNTLLYLAPDGDARRPAPQADADRRRAHGLGPRRRLDAHRARHRRSAGSAG